jgi:hypothetical protein
MNRRTDFDDHLRDWAELGDERLPSRYLDAALAKVDTTPQRGASWWPLEGILMNLKPAAPILGVAAVVVLAIAGYQLFGGNIGGPPSPTPTASPRTFTEADLPTIILTEGNAPEGLTVDATTTGSAALNTPFKPGGPLMPEAGFVDALMTNLNSTDAGGFVTWAALYQTPADAQAAFEVLVAEHESPVVGWGLETQSHPAPRFGEEDAFYVGAAYAFDAAEIYVWRANNLLLAAVAVDVAAVDAPVSDQLLSIARGMDSRTR